MKGKGLRSLLTLGERGYDRFIYYLALVGAGLVAVMMLIVVYEVVMRYIFNNPTNWVNIVSEFLLVYCVYLAVA